MAEKKIGDHTYKVEPLLATHAIKLQARLLKLVGPALDKLPAILSGRSKGDSTVSDAAAIAAFSDIFTKSDPDEFTDLLRDVCEVAMVKRPSGYDQLDFDGDFTGKLDKVIPVALFVLQEQFGDFFAAALGNGKAGLKGAH